MYYPPKPYNLITGLVAVECWETVLPDALHATRSLCTATNATPHELLLSLCRDLRLIAANP